MIRLIKSVRKLNPIMFFLILKNAILALKTPLIRENDFDIQTVSMVRPDIRYQLLNKLPWDHMAPVFRKDAFGTFICIEFCTKAELICSGGEGRAGDSPNGPVSACKAPLPLCFTLYRFEVVSLVGIPLPGRASDGKIDLPDMLDTAVIDYFQSGDIIGQVADHPPVVVFGSDDLCS